MALYILIPGTTNATESRASFSVNTSSSLTHVSVEVMPFPRGTGVLKTNQSALHSWRKSLGKTVALVLDTSEHKKVFPASDAFI